MTSSVGTEGQAGGQPLGQQAEFLAEKMAEVRREISKAIVGQTEVVDGVLIALLADGHVLVETSDRQLASARRHAEELGYRTDVRRSDVLGATVLVACLA